MSPAPGDRGGRAPGGIRRHAAQLHRWLGHAAQLHRWLGHAAPDSHVGWSLTLVLRAGDGHAGQAPRPRAPGPGPMWAVGSPTVRPANRRGTATAPPRNHALPRWMDQRRREAGPTLARCRRTRETGHMSGPGFDEEDVLIAARALLDAGRPEVSVLDVLSYIKGSEYIPPEPESYADDLPVRGGVRRNRSTGCARESVGDRGRFGSSDHRHRVAESDNERIGGPNGSVAVSGSERHGHRGRRRAAWPTGGLGRAWDSGVTGAALMRVTAERYRSSLGGRCRSITKRTTARVDRLAGRLRKCSITSGTPGDSRPAQ